MTDNPAWEAKIDPLVRVLFVTPSVTSRMLRLLLRNREMTQARFMDEYHRRCDREHPSRSSFNANFGRFLATSPRSHYYASVVKDIQRQGRMMSDDERRRLHERDVRPVYDQSVPLGVMRRSAIPGKGNANMLTWIGPGTGQILARMSLDELQHAYEHLERELTHQRATDVEGETDWWLAELRAEMTRREGTMAARQNPRHVVANPEPNPEPNPYQVHSKAGLEGMFADRDDADALAGELKKAGAKGVEVRGPTLKLRPTRYPGSPPMHHAPLGRPPGVPNPKRRNPGSDGFGDARVAGRVLRGQSDLEGIFQAAADAREEGRGDLDDTLAKLYDEVPFFAQPIIFRGMARALWVTSYADWVDNKIDDFRKEMDDPDQQDELDELNALRPPQGVNWEEHAPQTPPSADFAAEDLAVLFERANNASTKDPTCKDHTGKARPCMLEDLYHRAVEADAEVAKAPFVPDEAYAETFGHYLAMQALGHGVSWFDDHAKFQIRFPSFEAYVVDGRSLDWSPPVIKRGEVQVADWPEMREAAEAEKRGRQNPDEPAMWRVWIGTSPNSYTDVMARSEREAMVRGAPVFKAEHHGEVVEINARRFGQKASSPKLVRIQRDGRIVFS